MNCSTAPDRPSSENISPEETAGAVANGVGQLDLDRASAYAGLTSLRSGQSEAYAREEKLLARKYGDQHPRVLAVAQRRAANEVFLRDLAVAHALAATPPPQTDATTYSFPWTYPRLRSQAAGPAHGRTLPRAGRIPCQPRIRMLRRRRILLSCAARRLKVRMAPRPSATIRIYDLIRNFFTPNASRCRSRRQKRLSRDRHL